MQPVAVTPDETTTRCCAGVRVFLEHPSDPTLVFTAQVSTEGSPFTARPVTREGDVVYVQGLQAGTPYNIRLTGRNQLGSVMANVTTTPLIGEPLSQIYNVCKMENLSYKIISTCNTIHNTCILFYSKKIVEIARTSAWCVCCFFSSERATYYVCHALYIQELVLVHTHVCLCVSVHRTELVRDV